MQSRPCVLVVEDNKTEQRLVTLLLDRFGFGAVVAATGQQAIELVQSGGKYDLILMDWQMGDMTGLDCTRRIRELQGRGGRFVPIVAVTANAMFGDRQKCLAAGMDDYLSKPYTTSQFQSMLSLWVARDQSLTG